MTTRYGNEISKVDTAVFDQDSGEIVGAFCFRGKDRRYYRVSDLRHPEGIAGIMSELESAPNKEAQNE